MTTPGSRRAFLKNTALTGIMSGFSTVKIVASSTLATGENYNPLNFVFQGDSITDGNRGRNKDPNHILGHGYAFSIASRVGASFAEKGDTFYNRGISGNKVTDLAQRWQVDTLDLKPDVLSILIGVNDTDSVIRQQNMVNVDEYETVYRSLLVQTTSAFPTCVPVLCEPFIMPVGRVKESWNAWNDDNQKRQAVVRRLAKEFNAVFVPLQKVFTDAVSRAPAEYWVWDGIHPTYSGHELITRQWLHEVGKRLPFLRKIHC